MDTRVKDLVNEYGYHWLKYTLQVGRIQYVDKATGKHTIEVPHRLNEEEIDLIGNEIAWVDETDDGRIDVYLEKDVEELCKILGREPLIIVEE